MALLVVGRWGVYRLGFNMDSVLALHGLMAAEEEKDIGVEEKEIASC